MWYRKAQENTEEEPAVQQQAQPVNELVTHDGFFHADDVSALSVLRHLYPNASFKRSRADADIKPAPGKIIWDVGHTYDHDSRVYDHHQSGGAGEHDFKHKDEKKAPSRLASFGLIWRHYGKEYLTSLGIQPQFVDAVWQKMNDSIVRGMDEWDNGQSQGTFDFGITHVPQIVSDMMPQKHYDDAPATAEDLHNAMLNASTVVGQIIKNRALAIYKQVREKVVVEDIAKKHEENGGGPILELPSGMSYSETVSKMPDVMSVVYPTDKGDWNAVQVSKSSTDRASKQPFPEQWCGKKGEHLDHATGADKAGLSGQMVFCHNTGWLLVAKSREAIMFCLKQMYG